MTSEDENQNHQQIQEHAVHAAEAMLQPEGLPSADQLLQSPDQLQAIVQNPRSFIDDSMSEEERTEAQQAVDALRNEALTKIIAPEGLAEGSRTVVEGFIAQTEEVLAQAGRAVDMVSEGLQEGLQRGRQVNDHVYDARRAMVQIRDALESGRPDELEVARYQLSRLRDFQETYGVTQRVLTNAYEEGSRSSRRATSHLDEAQDGANRAFKEIGALESRADSQPEDMYHEGVEQKVVERGAKTVEEHDSQCQMEVTQDDQFIGMASHTIRSAAELAQQVSVSLSRADAINELPHAGRLADGIDHLGSMIYKLTEYGPEMRRLAFDAFEELDMQVRRVETVMQAVDQQGRRDTEMLDDLRQRLHRVRAGMQH